MRKAVTDPQKLRKNDPGHPEVCVVFSYHKKFNPAEVEWIDTNCRSGALGCVECKLNCSAKISTFLAPVLEKRSELEKDLSIVLDVLSDGEREARKTAGITMQEVRTNMKMG
jgi:tryptophanyl-tRNA synthetase